MLAKNYNSTLRRNKLKRIVDTVSCVCNNCKSYFLKEGKFFCEECLVANSACLGTVMQPCHWQCTCLLTHFFSLMRSLHPMAQVKFVKFCSILQFYS